MTRKNVLRHAKTSNIVIGHMDMLSRFKNVRKGLHYNGNTVCISWYGDIGTMKQVPIFGSRYYPVDQAPAFIRRMMEASRA